ncbi:hypothetical protein M9Y10_007881 [Tritrichomonas musculus]|uniref:Uncharacterized protein n=1 Tax=Tritrichomonas musculus TaxID=1915356 RepID=A0ABR2J420_9EUKA
MQSAGIAFKRNLNNLLTGNPNGRVPKALINKYHKMACESNPNIRKISRMEMRKIQLYFENFADQSKIILNEITHLQNMGHIDFIKDFYSLKDKIRRMNGI